MRPVRIVMTPVGSAGDVYPFIGLGRALSQRGLDVHIVTSGAFRQAIEDEGLGFSETLSAEEFERISAHPDLWHPLRGLRYVLGRTADGLRLVYDRIGALHVPGRTMLIGHTLGFATRIFEEMHRVPTATIQLAPSVFRSDFAQPALLPGIDLSRLPRSAKRLLWWMLDRQVIDPPIAPALNAWRRELGLLPISRVFREWIHSPQRVIGLFPPWFGAPQPDWPAALALTGFPLYDAPQPIDDALADFLESGGRPILFTPGSGHREATRFFEAAVDGANRLGRRALLVSRHRAHIPDQLPRGVRYEPYVPFSAVLRRCAAIVHHGGVGTCAQGLAAGVPQLLMPQGFDQPDNATRLERLGVASWILPSRFTGDAIARALARLEDDSAVSAACARWAGAVAESNGIDETCMVIETDLRTHFGET